jgi:hypothetical protein
MENDKQECYICGATCTTLPSISALVVYDCPFCGLYQISYTSSSTFEHEYSEKTLTIAGFLSEHNKSNHSTPYTLNTDSINSILSDVRVPKTVIQKLERFLYYCYLEYDFLGQEFTLDKSGIKKTLGQDRKNIVVDSNRKYISYFTRKELYGAINAMSELNWVHANKMTNADVIVSFSLTTHGLYVAEQLVQSNIGSKKVFVAIEYHGDYLEKMNSAISPACRSCGFEAFLASDTEHNHNINDEMIVDIKRSLFMISDFTNNNEGAYYEAGYAAGMGLQVIKCCHKDWIEKLHFDVNHDKFIVYDDLADFENQLRVRIRATISGAILED